MSKKNKSSELENQDEPIKLSSPPCLMSEVDPEYMGLTGLIEKNKQRKKDKKKF